MKDIHMKSRFFRIRWCTSALLALTNVSGAWAETALEKQILDAPAPHEVTAPEKPTVVAHFATLVGFINGKPDNDARLQALHEAVTRCVDQRREMNAPVNPPMEWPQWLNGERNDFYATDHYAITYHQVWVYGALNPDCSHFTLGNHVHTAVLKSAAGMCHIDLLKKTAKGQCTIEAHRRAPIRFSAPVLQDAASQQIAGLRCQARNFPLGEVCIATDGKMTSAYPLVLSNWIGPGMQLKAVQASLDMTVSERIFTPHLQGEFQIQEIKK